jgi:hypothetical protein
MCRISVPLHLDTTIGQPSTASVVASVLAFTRSDEAVCIRENPRDIDFRIADSD